MGHSFSRANLIVFMYLKFLIPKLLDDVFSDLMPFAVSNNNDASHDYNKVIMQIMSVELVGKETSRPKLTCSVEKCHYLNNTIMKEISDP